MATARYERRSKGGEKATAVDIRRGESCDAVMLERADGILKTDCSGNTVVCESDAHRSTGGCARYCCRDQMGDRLGRGERSHTEDQPKSDVVGSGSVLTKIRR